ncbi:MAG TPA: hypothetical protein VNZ45_08950, partial [Bacteroidia bacterium]|nr:hypothetical protein [Bacteroidia bacterium]
MRKLLPLLFLTFILGSSSALKAQCYGTVVFDQAASANGASTFTINTTNPNELILISYDGWPSPGAGPITVDGNPATFLQTGFDLDNSGVAEVWCYSAPAAGVHTIVCTETNYSYPPYGLNFAAAFYATGTCTPLSCSNVTPITVNTITCVTGGTITGTVTTTIANSMIYCNFENNNGQGGPFVDTWTGATFLAQLHEGNGIDASHAYKTAAATGLYTISCGNGANPSNGCGGLVIVLCVIQPPLCSGTLTLTTTQVNPTCGNTNGSATVGVSGGVAPYTYTWSPSGGTSANATGLSAGTYTVTVKDKNGCTATASVTLVASASVVATISANNPVKCNGGATGSATVTATGGTAPYTYTWTPVGGTNATASNLTAGTYTITVKDKNGCVGTASVTITQPTVLTASTTNTPAKCNGGATGSATVTAGGGTPAYLYSWAPSGGTNALASNLTAGTYTVTVTDANGCTITATATITQPPALTACTTNTPVKCNGGATGSATVTAG